ncbi:MAG: ABC transporter permease subunit [Actinobacteria bacterium]|nr:ABC transporter permease subunit [Actinomycetota bacterium]
MNFLGDVARWLTASAQWHGTNGIPHRLYEHVTMSGAAIVTAAVIALPVGIVLGHLNRGGSLAVNVSNVGRAIPSFAILVLAAQVFGIGAVPAFCALVALAVPPMVTNAFVGMREVDADLRESARGMGMTGRQMLVRVELPVALPLVMAGIRTAAVQVVATATLAAVVAWGGLGRYIVDGLAQRDNVQVFGGALVVAVLSIATELALAGVQRLVVPVGLRGQDLTIGGLNFSESTILADIYQGALKSKGFNVNVRPSLGSREVVAPALERGEIDLYPGYAATDLEFYNNSAGEATPDANATVAKLRERLAPKGLAALDPSPAVDMNAFAVTKATADKYKLTKLSDLAPIAGQLVLGGPPECPKRPFCQPGLEKTYGLKFKDFKALDAGGPLSKNALEKGDVDIALIFSSDGAIPAKGFVVLQDDKKLQNSDNIVPIIRSATVDTQARAVLNQVSAALTTDDLAALNKRADTDKEDPDVLAKEWLNSHGFKA